VLESTGGMLFGMGPYKTGFLTGKHPMTTYVWYALVGLLFSAPFYVIGMSKVYRNQFDFITAEVWLYRPYEVLRLISGVAKISILIILFVKSNSLCRVKAALAAVRQMAFSNYIFTSIVAQYLFLWSPWVLHRKLSYLQHHFVMLCIWALNIGVSLIWLRTFQFGPLEWAWRSRTYWKLQPTRGYRPLLAVWRC